MSHLQVVVVDDETQEPGEEPLAFARGQSVDVLYVVAECEDGFPACYRVGTDYLGRVRGG